MNFYSEKIWTWRQLKQSDKRKKFFYQERSDDALNVQWAYISPICAQIDPFFAMRRFQPVFVAPILKKTQTKKIEKSESTLVCCRTSN